MQNNTFYPCQTITLENSKGKALERQQTGAYHPAKTWGFTVNIY
jgi:hypothetical protein